MRTLFWILNAIISIAAGILVGYLFSIPAIPNIVTAVWIALAIALLILFLAPVYRYAGHRGHCCSEEFSFPLIIGAALSIAFSIAALAITLTPALIAVAVFIGLGVLFFTFTFITFIGYLICLTK